MEQIGRAQKRILRRPTVKDRIGIEADSTLYDLMDRGYFPRPIKIGPRAVGWLESEIDAWLAARVAARDAACDAAQAWDNAEDDEKAKAIAMAAAEANAEAEGASDAAETASDEAEATGTDGALEAAA